MFARYIKLYIKGLEKINLNANKTNILFESISFCVEVTTKISRGNTSSFIRRRLRRSDSETNRGKGARITLFSDYGFSLFLNP